jgi:hypothetical protein
MPLPKKEALELVRRRHPEWMEHQRHWRFLADSLEGGHRYRGADYTIDPTAVVGDGSSYAPWYNFGYDPLTSEPYPVSYRQIVDRNLIPHLSETGSEGRDLYVMRLARTPVPAIVERTVEAHLSRIFSREVRRSGPDALGEWWLDVDGKGTPADRWMLETVAPLLLVLGQLDLCFDHPLAPPGTKVVTRADALRLGLTACVASVILPENLVWWRLDSRGADYAECLVFERHALGVCYRHWTDEASDAYDPDGNHLEGWSREHPFGRVPIKRVFDRRKVRCENVGRSRYESIASAQKAVYNAESERILSEVQQSHAQLCMPDDYLQSDSQIPVGPDKILPMKKLIGSNGQTSGYQAPMFLEPPKGAQEALRTHVLDLQDTADRDGALAKPAGIVGGTSTGQSGVSKIADQVDGNALLGRVAEVLANCERSAGAVALTVLQDGGETPADIEAIAVDYPKQFDLYTAADLAQAADDIQRIAAAAGALPQLEGELVKRLIDVLLPGLDDVRLDELRGEVDAFMAEASAPVDAQPPGQNDPAADETLSGEALVASPSSVLLSPTPA